MTTQPDDTRASARAVTPARGRMTPEGDSGRGSRSGSSSTRRHQTTDATKAPDTSSASALLTPPPSGQPPTHGARHRHQSSAPHAAPSPPAPSKQPERLTWQSVARQIAAAKKLSELHMPHEETPGVADQPRCACGGSASQDAQANADKGKHKASAKCAVHGDAGSSQPSQGCGPGHTERDSKRAPGSRTKMELQRVFSHALQRENNRPLPWLTSRQSRQQETTLQRDESRGQGLADPARPGTTPEAAARTTRSLAQARHGEGKVARKKG